MVELTFNFIGVETVDFGQAYGFYTEMVGIDPAASATTESWAMLVSGMDDSPVANGISLRCELFEQDGEPPDERRWGHHQNLRPSMQVEDLEATIEALQQRGISFTGTIEETAWGRSIEFRTPEGVRWSLAHATDFSAGRSLATPHLGWAELKVANRDRQERFYTEIMGLSVGARYDESVRLDQGPGEPRLFLESGGEHEPGAGTEAAPFLGHPVWMSFETPDINEASAWLGSHGVPLLQEITAHDWAGKDIVIEDPEGNPIQVVEYLDH